MRRVGGIWRCIFGDHTSGEVRERSERKKEMFSSLWMTMSVGLLRRANLYEDRPRRGVIKPLWSICRFEVFEGFQFMSGTTSKVMYCEGAGLGKEAVEKRSSYKAGRDGKRYH